MSQNDLKLHMSWDFSQMTTNNSLVNSSRSTPNKHFFTMSNDSSKSSCGRLLLLQQQHRPVKEANQSSPSDEAA